MQRLVLAAICGTRIAPHQAVPILGTAGVHRIIEQQAAVRGDAFAYLDGRRALTYRQLNARANAVARALIATGFKRGSIALVRMDPSAELAVALLAILKAGGAYKLATRDADACPRGLSALDTTDAGDTRVRPLDVLRVLTSEVPPSANLPILARASDVACVLPSVKGEADVLVPHATLASLLERQQFSEEVEWSAESEALDLWVALMTGATVTVADAPVEMVAA